MDLSRDESDGFVDPNRSSGTRFEGIVVFFPFLVASDGSPVPVRLNVILPRSLSYSGGSIERGSSCLLIRFIYINKLAVELVAVAYLYGGEWWSSRSMSSCSHPPAV